MPVLQFSLPFFTFEKHLYHTIVPEPVRFSDVNNNNLSLFLNEPRTRSSGITRQSALARVGIIFDMNVEILKAAFPTEMIRCLDPLVTSINNHETQLYNSPLHRLILFSLANDFAGLGALSMKNFIEYLWNETSQLLLQTLLTASGCYTIQAIARSLFKVAIEVGDANAVKFILQNDSLRINVNSFICSLNGDRCTPLSRASKLQHKEVVKALLNYGADVKLKNPKYGESGYCALDYAIKDTAMPGTEVFKPDIELVRMLLDAEDRMSACSIHKLLCDQINRDFLYQIISKHASSCHKEWGQSALFISIVKSTDNESTTKIMEILLNVGADLTHDHLNMHQTDFTPYVVYSYKASTVIDAVANKGDLGTMKLLLNSGIALCDDTLTLAITSGNEELVRFLLEKGASIESTGRLKIAPLTAAIRLGHDGENIFNLIVGEQALKHMHDPLHLQSSLEAAIEVGNANIVEILKPYLLKHLHNPSYFLTVWSAASKSENDQLTEYLKSYFREHQYDSSDFSVALADSKKIENFQFVEFLVGAGYYVSPCNLGIALAHAIKKEQDQLAYMLIDAGADTNAYFGLEIYNKPLVEALIRRNAPLVRSLIEADAHPHRHGCEKEVSLAVEWGDRSIIKELINAGANLNVTITKQEKTVSILTIAVQTGDRELVSYLLYAGSNPNAFSPAEFDEFGTDITPLMAAVKKEDVEMIQLLFEHGADPYDPGAFNEAAEHRGILTLLLDRHYSMYPQGNKNIGGQALASTIRSKDIVMLQKMIEKGLDMTIITTFWWDVDGCDEWYEETSPFSYAITKAGKDGDLEILELILSAGYSPQVVVARDSVRDFPPDFPRDFPRGSTQSRVTAFLAAINTGDVSLVKLFLKHGADVNYFGIHLKRTPLQKASESGHIGIVQLLINSGANVNSPAARRGGGTALQLATIGGYLGIISLLIDCGADVDAPASKLNGFTALEAAAKYGRTDTVALLLNAGAGRKGEDRTQFDNAIRYAREEEHKYICDMLTCYLEKGTLSSGPEVFDDLIDWNFEDEGIFNNDLQDLQVI